MARALPALTALHTCPATTHSFLEVLMDNFQPFPRSSRARCGPVVARAFPVEGLLSLWNFQGGVGQHSRTTNFGALPDEVFTG